MNDLPATGIPANNTAMWIVVGIFGAILIGLLIARAVINRRSK